MTDKMRAPAAMEPLQVAVVGTGDGTIIRDKTTAVTPDASQPNLVVRVVSPLMAILIRFINTYLTVLVGLIAAGLANNNIIPASDFLDLVTRCAGLSVAGAGFGALKDLVTVFGRLENKYPLLTGNV